MTGKQTIYLVMRSSDYEGGEIHGAFATRELANTYLENFYRSLYKDDWDGMVGNPIPGSEGMKSPEEITIGEINTYFEQFGHQCWIETKTLES